LNFPDFTKKQPEQDVHAAGIKKFMIAPNTTTACIPYLHPLAKFHNPRALMMGSSQKPAAEH
jgi:hypothetical protein